MTDDTAALPPVEPDAPAAESAAAFAALDGELAPPAAAPDAPGAALALEWDVIAGGLVGVVANVIAPNWELTAAECAALRAPLADVLRQFLPDVNLDPRWQSVAALVLAAGAIAATRYDAATGLRPLRRPEPTRGEAAAPVRGAGLDAMNLGAAAS